MFSHLQTETLDLWLKDYFKSPGAGAEFMLPWTVDTYFTTVNVLKELFSPAELKTIIDAHEHMVIDTSHLRLAHLLLQVLERCDQSDIHARYGADANDIESKCRQLDDTQAAVLILWALAFWRGQNNSAEAMEKYIARK
jgi:hypothetical protein